MNHHCNHPGFISWNNEEHRKWLKPQNVWWKTSSQGLTLVSYCHRLPVDSKAARTKRAKLSRPNNLLNKKKNERKERHLSSVSSQKEINTSPAPFQKTLLEILVAGDYRLKGWGTHESVEWFRRKEQDFPCSLSHKQLLCSVFYKFIFKVGPVDSTKMQLMANMHPK